MIGSHAQGLDEELDGFIDAVLIVQAKAAHIQSVCIRGVHSQNVTDLKEGGGKIQEILLLFNIN